MGLSRSILQSLIAVCHHPSCPRLHPASQLQFQSQLLNRRLSSSEILAATGTASLPKNGAAGSSGHGGHILTPTVSGNFLTHLPIGSLGGYTISTNVEPRPNGSGTCTVLFNSGPRYYWTRSFHQGFAANNSDLPGSGAAKARRAEEEFGRASLTHGHNLRPDESGISSASSQNTDWGLTFRPSSTVVLKGVGSTLVEGDIRRLVPRKKHLPSFKDDIDILRVIPCRDMKSLDRRPLYQLVFSSAAAAQAFAYSNSSVFAQPRSLWPTVRFPPASDPEFSCLDARSAAIKQQHATFQRVLGLDGASKTFGQMSVLLIAYGPGGSNYMLRLPKSAEIIIILEELGVKFFQKASKDRAIAVERIVEDGGVRKVLNRPMEDARWIIKCHSESEAQRVVRALHKKPPWEGSGCVFRAEVI